ncbi:MAG: restriction endonuclease [Bacteroidales bacterium]
MKKYGYKSYYSHRYHNQQFKNDSSLVLKTKLDFDEWYTNYEESTQEIYKELDVYEKKYIVRNAGTFDLLFAITGLISFVFILCSPLFKKQEFNICLLIPFVIFAMVVSYAIFARNKDLYNIVSSTTHKLKKNDKYLLDAKTIIDESKSTIIKKDEYYSQLKDEKATLFSQIASMYSDFTTVQYDISAEYLERKSRPAFAEASRIKELKAETRKYIEQYKVMSYKYNTLLNLFPEIASYVEDYETIKELADSKYHYVHDMQEDYDSVRGWVSKEEYMQLGEDDRNQLALDNYIKRDKRNWAIGRDYELSCGHLLRQAGFCVDQFGIEKKFEDLGRDIIAWRFVNGIKNIYIIQCKYWAKDKLIHEKHLAQLYGTTVMYEIGLQDKLFKSKVIPMFMTNIDLSKEALKFAEHLNIHVLKKDMVNFPRIKCNVNNGEKIYHLPFDQQYDTAKIEKEGEFYAWTVSEATEKGFRRAKKWIQDN